MERNARKFGAIEGEHGHRVRMGCRQKMLPQDWAVVGQSETIADTRYFPVRKGTGSQVLGSWNEEVRADSGLYRVKEAAVVAVCNCVVRVCSALFPSSTLGYAFREILRYV